MAAVCVSGLVLVDDADGAGCVVNAKVTTACKVFCRMAN